MGGSKLDRKKFEMIAKLSANRVGIYRDKAADKSISAKKRTAALLAEGKKEQARVMVAKTIADDYTVEVHQIVHSYLMTLVARIDTLVDAKTCPEVCQEAACSVIYSAPYLSNDSKFGQVELLKVRKMLLKKFGKKFPNQCIQSGCVNPKLIHHLTSKDPVPDALIDFYLKAISGDADLHPLAMLTAAEEGEQAEAVEFEVVESGKAEEVAPATINGVLVVDQAKNSWVIDPQASEVKPVFIPPDKLNAAENGDEVTAVVTPRSDGKLAGAIQAVTKKASAAAPIEATLEEDASGNMLVRLEGASAGKGEAATPVYIAAHELNGAEVNDRVRVQQHPVWRRDAPLSGAVTDVLEKAPKEFAAVVVVDAKGNSFVQDAQKKEKPIYVPAKHLNTALNGDVVTAICNPARAGDGGKKTARVVNIFKRAVQPREITSKFIVDARGNFWVKDPDREKPIFIPAKAAGGAKNGDTVLCRANPPREDGNVVGKVLSVLERAPEPREVTGILEKDASGKHWVRAQRATALGASDAASAQLKAFEAKAAGAVRIPDKDLNGAMDGDIVQILAQPPMDDGTSVGKVVEVVAKGAFRGGRAGAGGAGKSSSFNPDKPAIVIDNGSGMVKAGFAGDDKPTSVFQTVTGSPVLAQATLGGAGGKGGKFVGQQALAKRGMLQLNYPVEHGVCKNWDDMEAIWAHTFDNELRVDPTDRGVLLTEAPRNPRANRERMAEIMFETFGIPALYVSIQAVLALYSSGRTTGLVVESGDGVTHVVPIFEGFSLDHAIQRVNLAGRDVTDYLGQLLTEHGSVMTTSSEREIVREIKEKLCYVSMDFAGDMKKSEREFETNYTLPDGKGLTAGSERFRAPEVLFQPSFLGQDMGGIQHLIYKSVMACDLDLRRPLWNSLVLGGGNTMMDGFDNRLKMELDQLVTDPGTKVEIVDTPHRQHSVFHGGSVVAALDSFRERWATREAYDEQGPACMHSLLV